MVQLEGYQGVEFDKRGRNGLFGGVTWLDTFKSDSGPFILRAIVCGLGDQTDRCGMALINCPDCGKRISDQAPECNQCGRPMQPARTEAEESTEDPTSPESQPTTAGSQRPGLPEDPGLAIGGIGAGIGVAIIVSHSVTAGLVIAGITVAIGLWIQYGPYRRHEYPGTDRESRHDNQ